MKGFIEVTLYNSEKRKVIINISHIISVSPKLYNAFSPDNSGACIIAEELNRMYQYDGTIEYLNESYYVLNTYEEVKKMIEEASN